VGREVNELIKLVAPLRKLHAPNEEKVKESQKKSLGDFYDHTLPYGIRENKLNMTIFGAVVENEPTVSLTNKRIFF